MTSVNHLIFVANFVARLALISTDTAISTVAHDEFQLGGGGGVQQQKRSCRREKPKISFVFFVLFRNTLKIDVFVPNFGQKCVLKQEQKRS